jgi:putative Mg2+ transporter-C (MgtC) family protein
VPVDIAGQLELSLRLVLAAVLGGVIGFEREIHQHPAGTRTHLLVSLGAGVFTVLSIAGFNGSPGEAGDVPRDPARVAAQIVSGIGFLGAGAILKYGTTIKGLTTAASLWATAAVGMAAGAGVWVIALVGTGLAIVSLWPLHAALDRIRLQGGRTVRMRLAMDDLGPLAGVTGEASNRRIEIAGIRTERSGSGYEIELDLRIPPGAVPSEVIAAFGRVPDVTLLSAERAEDQEL